MPKPAKVRVEARLKDALCNLSPRSGAGVDYNRGLMVGVVSTLMAFGYDFQQAVALLAPMLPPGLHWENLPDAWHVDFQEAIMRQQVRHANAKVRP